MVRMMSRTVKPRELPITGQQRLLPIPWQRDDGQGGVISGCREAPRAGSEPAKAAAVAAGWPSASAWARGLGWAPVTVRASASAAAAAAGLALVAAAAPGSPSATAVRLASVMRSG